MDNYFDVIVLGTGLTESIAAAALSKAGFKVAHIDPNPYYGADEASLSLEEVAHWVNQHKDGEGNQTVSPGPRYHSVTHRGGVPPHARQYSVSLAPSVIPSIGPFISSLISSGVSRYGSFKLLGRVLIYDNGVVKDVPQSKDNIFQDKAMSLLEKRRVMRFLMFAGGDFENSEELRDQGNLPFMDFLQSKFLLNDVTARAITYALAQCYFTNEPTLPALHRIRTYLRASGHYGSSSFLVGYYGGSGEIAQGFCRTSAVAGAVYILGRTITNIVSLSPAEPEHPSPTPDPARFTVEVEDLPDRLYCQCVISSATILPDRLRPQADIVRPTIPSRSFPQPVAIARCIAIIDGSVTFPRYIGTEASGNTSDSSLLVFPPESLEGGSTMSAIHVMTAGPGTMSAPIGKGILYISMALLSNPGCSAETLLSPYLTAVLVLLQAQETTLICSTFYIQELSSYTPTASNSVMGLLAVPSLSPHPMQSVNEAAIAAEAAFRMAVASLLGERKTLYDQGSERNGFWPSSAEMDESGDDNIQW